MFKNQVTEEQKNQMVELYIQTQNVKTLIRVFGGNYNYYLKLLKSRGIEYKPKSKNEAATRYECNHSAFQSLAPESAYWAGFLAADGYIDEKRNTISITLQMEDESLLKRFLKFLSCSKPISYKINKKTNHRYASITINSPKITKDLVKLNIKQNKSLTLLPPILEPNLIPHFIRGYFDGDGCISLTKTSKGSFRPLATITSTREICEWIQQALQKEGIKSHIYQRTSENTYRIDIPATCNIQVFGAWLYRDAKIYLERKYNKFVELGKVALGKPKQFCIYKTKSNKWLYDFCCNGKRHQSKTFDTKQEAFNECYALFKKVGHPCINKLVQLNSDCAAPII